MGIGFWFGGQVLPRANDVVADGRGLIYSVDRQAECDVLEYLG
jgi:hypothetical protein